MISAIRNRLSYSNAIATLALFIALGGVAVAAGLPRNSVGTRQLKKRAVTAAKLAPKSVIGGKLGPNSVGPGNIGNGAVTSAKLAANSVIASTIKNGVITNNKLGNEVVTTPKLANGSVTNAKLGNEVAPLLGTLKTGQTLRGAFDLGTEATGATDFVSGGISYPFPLTNMPTTNPVLAAGGSTANCPGVAGGNQQTPNANPGNLCVYVSAQSGEAGTLEIENPSRLGFGLRANAKGAGAYNVTGFWAVTAP